MSLTGDPVREDLLVTESDVSKAVFSPNGQWFAYMSSDSGVTNVYVRPFPNADSAGHPISTNGGTNPMWAPDGRELFYADLDGRLLAVPVQTDPTFARLGTATVALEGDYRLLSFYLGGLGRPYDIDQSGERFLVLKSKAALGSASRSVPLPRFVLNWLEELKERVPVNLVPLESGTTLGPYAVTAKIGDGGMGEVYRARDTKLDRDVALKVLPQEANGCGEGRGRRR